MLEFGQDITLSFYFSEDTKMEASRNDAVANFVRVVGEGIEWSPAAEGFVIECMNELFYFKEFDPNLMSSVTQISHMIQ